MARRHGGDWPGGYIHLGVDGRKTYVIRRLGREVSTRATTLRAAIKHLERFESDPEGYTPGCADPGSALMLDAALVEDFIRWSRDERRNTKAWVRDQRHYLAWWGDKLAGKDLRRLTMLELEEALKGVTRYKRAEVLKTLYRWMRKRGRITASQDPTLDGLDARPPDAEQLTRDKTVAPARFRAALSSMVGVYRDCLIILAATGWHVTELYRFACRGAIKPYRGEDGPTCVLVCPWHKAGEPHQTAVGSEAEASARALLKHGPFSRSRLDKAVREACRLAGVDEFTPGMMRHTVATHAVEHGAPLAAVADFLGHRSERTTKRFYATHATAKKVPTPV